MDAFVKKMDLSTALRDEDDEPVEALQPKNTFNPVVQHLNQCMAHRALNPDEPLPTLDPVIDRYRFSFVHCVLTAPALRYLRPDEMINKAAKDEIEKLTSDGLFRLVKVPFTLARYCRTHISQANQGCQANCCQAVAANGRWCGGRC